MTDQYQENVFAGNQEEAIKRMCLHWDMYVEDGLMKSSRKIDASRSRIKAYVKNCNMTQYAGKTYDTYLDEQKTDAITSMKDLENVQNEKNINIPKNSIKFWGFGFSPEEYEFLNNQYAEWKTKCVVNGKAREGLVKDLCNIELHKRKALQDEDIDLYDKLTKTYQTVMSNANLSPKQEDESDKAGEKPIGVMIDMFEDTRPIPEPSEEWKDVDGIIKMFSIYFLGHLAKMLGLKNRYSKMYEEEMAKYRVEIPELEESDDEDVFDFLVNNGDEQNE